MAARITHLWSLTTRRGARRSGFAPLPHLDERARNDVRPRPRSPAGSGRRNQWIAARANRSVRPATIHVTCRCLTGILRPPANNVVRRSSFVRRHIGAHVRPHTTLAWTCRLASPPRNTAGERARTRHVGSRCPPTGLPIVARAGTRVSHAPCSPTQMRPTQRNGTQGTAATARLPHAYRAAPTSSRVRANPLSDAPPRVLRPNRST